MMKFILFMFLGMSAAHAAEITLVPNLGYSNYLGLNYHIGAIVDFEMTNRWQLGGGASYQTDVFHIRSNADFFFGPTYNFSDDLLRSYFVGFGIGYQKHYPWDYDHPSAYVYGRIGKRFLLSEDYKVTYKPSIEVRGGRDGGELILAPFSFSILI
jgi:hypothetical protein